MSLVLCGKFSKRSYKEIAFLRGRFFNCLFPAGSILPVFASTPTSFFGHLLNK